MKIAIRMDDVTPDMDWGKFLRFKELCDLYRIKPLIGIVPDNRDEMLHVCEPGSAPAGGFWEYIRQLKSQGWSIAQHGMYHIYTTKKMGCFPLNRLSEFAGVPYGRQYEMLGEGRELLRQHGIETDMFMAPAHSFDRNTIRALRKLGFRRITDGFGDRPYSRHGMVFYPISFRQGSSLKKTKGYTTFVVHANTMDEKDFERYEKLFARYRDRLISYTEYLAVQPQRRGAAGAVREYMMAAAKFALVSLHGHA